MPSRFFGKIEVFYDKERLVEAAKKIYNFVLFVGAVSLELRKRKKRKRKNFSKSTQKYILARQGNVCNSCKNPSKFYDYHHIGRRDDNSASSGEALCLECHAEKTRKKKKLF